MDNKISRLRMLLTQNFPGTPHRLAFNEIHYSWNEVNGIQGNVKEAERFAEL